MPIRQDIINKFNRGEVDPEALSRDDITRVRNSCSSMVNFLPKRLGAMTYRPGFEYLDFTNASAFAGGGQGIPHFIPFVSSASDTALIEIGEKEIYFWVDDAVVASTSVTSTITNDDFSSGLTGWTDSSGSGSSVTGVSNQAVFLAGSGTRAELYQTIGSTDTNSEHTLNITVYWNPVEFKIGTSGVGSEDIFSDTLKPGIHFIVFEPDANITLTFSSYREYKSAVDSCVLRGNQDTTITLTYNFQDTLESLSYAQSADALFLAQNGANEPLYVIERRGTKSWSLVDYYTTDGPFRAINSSEITMSTNSFNGEATITASDDFFEPGHIGSLLRITSEGQTRQAAGLTSTGVGTLGVKVTGVGDDRKITIAVTNTFSATVRLQRSVDNTTWTNVGKDYISVTYEDWVDGFDNAILYYRLWVTGYSSGTIDLTISFPGGSIDGIAKINARASSTSVTAQVIEPFGAINTTTKDWYEGKYSDFRGWPTSVALYEGRLFLAGRSNIDASVSDAYYSFDDMLEGDSAPISKTIGFGPNDDVLWLMPATRLLMGLATGEIGVRSTNFGEPLSPTNCNLKYSSTQGAHNTEAHIIDTSVYFVQRSTKKILEATYGIDSDAYNISDLTILNESLLSPGVKRFVVSRHPETRIWAVLQDGTVAVLLIDNTEDILAWSRIEIANSCTVVDMVVLPREDEDAVYATIYDGASYYLSKMAKFSEAIGGTTSKHFDLFKTYTSPGTTITGLSHVDGETVGVWADGQDRGTYTVSSNQITVGSSWTDVVVGLPYTADYVSNKLSGYVSESVANRRKRVVDLGFVLRNYWPGSLTVGPSVALLEQFPDYEDGSAVDTTATMTDYDYLPFEFNGEEESDPRIFLRADGPVTVLSMTYGVLLSGDAPKGDSDLAGLIQAGGG